MIEAILPIRTQDGYQLGSNEPIGTGSINRVIEHLLKNDDLLRAKLEDLGYNHGIQMWSQSSIYSAGDLVVYMQKSGTEKVAYLLLCIKNNAKTPSYTLGEGKADFTGSGWKLIHASTYYLHNDEALLNNIVEPAVKAVIDDHEQSQNYHGGLIINDINDFSKMFIKSDVSNFTSPRLVRNDGVSDNTFLASAVSHSEQSGEFNITELSDTVVQLDVNFSFDSTANQDIQINGSRYYYANDPVKDKSDNHIFSSYYKESTQRLHIDSGRLVYDNIRIPGTNVFSRVIEFPLAFANTEYMVFQSSYRSDQFAFAATASELVSKTTAGEQSFVSQILFTNKTATSITAVLPIHAHFGKYGKFTVGVPWINRFRVSIVGVRK